VTTGYAVVLDTGTDTVSAEIVDAVGVITFNRPERRNALHAEMYEAVPRLLERYGSDDNVGCVLMTGAGSAFCAGGDVRDGGWDVNGTAGNDTESQVRSRAAALTRNARMIQLLREIPKVTIAALPGPAVGAGMSIALSTDLRIAASSARLIPGWGRLAFSGDFGGAWFLTQLVGPSIAMQLLIDGNPIDAEMALRLGLVNRVVDDADLRPAALAWAVEIAHGPTTAWAGVKANVAEAQDLPLDQALVRESERMVRCGMSAEHHAAVRAWLDTAAKKAAT
jgi:2-(1,2-epoxy-1,2-dihydrophenyl)acetyl-CoA isomerase